MDGFGFEWISTSGLEDFSRGSGVDSSGLGDCCLRVPLLEGSGFEDADWEGFGFEVPDFADPDREDPGFEFFGLDTRIGSGDSVESSLARLIGAVPADGTVLEVLGSIGFVVVSGSGSGDPRGPEGFVCSVLTDPDSFVFEDSTGSASEVSDASALKT